MKTIAKYSRFKQINFLIISIFFQFTIYAQTISLEAPTITLDHTVNNAVATINLNTELTNLNALEFTLYYDGSVLKPTGHSKPDRVEGAINGAIENKIIVGLYFTADPFGGTVPPYIDGLISFDFDFIGAEGTESPLMISITNIFDSDEDELSEISSTINGSISKTCGPNPITGCTNSNYEEYSPLANCDDGSCATLVCHDSNFQKINQYDNYTAVRPLLSSNGSRVAFIDNNVIKLFEAQNNSWVQIALDLTLDAYSYGITLSRDADKIAVISIDRTTSPYTYFVQTYFLVNNQWLKLTNDLFPDIGSFNEIVLSDDGNTLITRGFNLLKAYEWVNSEWQQKGDTFSGQQFWYPYISEDGNTILFNDGYVGTVTASLYNYDGSSWTPEGSLTGNNSTFSLNHTGDLVLQVEYKTPYIDPDLTFHGFDGSNWIQISATQSFLGTVGNVMNGDLTNFTITDRDTILNIYKYNGLEWTNETTITYENNGFRFWSCQFSQDGNALLVRGYYNDDDDVGLTAYYANECNDILEDFCVDTQVLNGVIDEGIYRSSNIISASGTVGIQSGGNVELESQNMVELMPGFVADGDVNFEISMQTCVPNN